jgi:hypothetical protein
MSSLTAAYPRFAVLFTDYSPEREQPLKTELRVASCVQNLDAFADDWLAANTGPRRAAPQ